MWYIYNNNNKKKDVAINKPRTGHPRKQYTRQRRAIKNKKSSNNPFLGARELAVKVTSTSGAIVISNTRCKYSTLGRREKHLLVKQIGWKRVDLKIFQLFFTLFVILFHWGFGKKNPMKSKFNIFTSDDQKK